MNSNQPTPGVKRKIPGPASKTLKRRNCNLEAETCNDKTKCLFCFNTVLVPYAAKADTDEDRKRVQLVKNLCNRVMKTNQDELPTVYSSEAFPFCASCQEHVQRLWEFDEIVRNAQIKIAETMLAIEKEVVNGEILKSSLGMSMSPSPANDKRFMKLRNVIFTGFRNKLLMKHKLSEKLLEAKEKRRGLAQLQATESSKDDNELDEKPDMTPIKPEVVEIRGSEKRQGQELSSTPCITVFTSDDEIEDGSSIERNEHTSSEAQDKGDSQQAPGDDITLGVTHTDMVIDDSSDMDTGSDTSGSAELITPHANLVSQSIAKEGRNREGVIMDGLVEIYWTSGSVPDEGYLHCTMCSHEIMFSTRKAEGLLHATSKMESHIKNQHQDEKNRIYSTTKTLPLVYSCGACGVVFADTLARDKHEVVHRTCEICGKQIGRKGNYNSHNMLLHANTHKSEAERKAGVEAGEKGYIARKQRKSGKEDKNDSF